MTEDMYEEEGKKPVGRQWTYTVEKGEEICSLISEGMSLRSILRRPNMPSLPTWFRWLREFEVLRNQYAQACDERTEAHAEEILEIADDGTNDWMDRKFGKETVQVVNNEAVQRSKLRVDTRKWLMSKMKPKKYGEKIDMTTDGKSLPVPIYGGQASTTVTVEKL